MDLTNGDPISGCSEDFGGAICLIGEDILRVTYPAAVSQLQVPILPVTPSDEASPRFRMLAFSFLIG